MAQPADVLEHFLLQVGDKIRAIERVDAAGKDKVLPDENAVAVAEVVEAFLLVEAAAPDTQHVLMRQRGIADQLFEESVGKLRGEGMGRDPV